MNTAHKLVEILEENGVEYIFGIPGEQIIPFYEALEKSHIKHILMRHEVAAAHAADAYTRITGKVGVCVSTAGPGALNLVMGVATAYKDRVPILVITGDNPTYNKYSNEFQSFPLNDVFEDITFRSYDPANGSEAITNLYEIFDAFEVYPRGPKHLNLSKDILTETDYEVRKRNYIANFDYENLDIVQDVINNASKPLLLLGSGANKSRDKIVDIVRKHNIPVLTTFTAKGIIDDYEQINLGLAGIRGSDRSDYAIENSDCIIALGTRLTSRTIPNIDDIEDKLIHVNINDQILVGDYPIQGRVEVFLDSIEFNGDYKQWANEILDIPPTLYTEGIHDDSIPLRPQSAIYSIHKYFDDNIIVNDAGSHTSWTTLLKTSNSAYKLLYSGGFAPMGYGVPGAIGASVAFPDEPVIVINGDGGFQMNLQELATIKQYGLNIIIFILNNSELGIIRQYEERRYDMKPYETELINPDFVRLAESYGIEATKIQTKKELELFLEENQNSRKPHVVEIIVSREDTPQPRHQESE
ncbi:MAG: thiamine pyrophosphate-binding protein [Methanobrevibacter sp.]|nr:thiamine pyrophosphate-binding protein [Methanobrevibacter sp.]